MSVTFVSTYEVFAQFLPQNELLGRVGYVFIISPQNSYTLICSVRLSIKQPAQSWDGKPRPACRTPKPRRAAQAGAWEQQRWDGN